MPSGSILGRGAVGSRQVGTCLAFVGRKSDLQPPVMQQGSDLSPAAEAATGKCP